MWRDSPAGGDFRHAGDDVTEATDAVATRKVPAFRLLEPITTARVPKFVLEELVAAAAAARPPAPPFARLLVIAAVVLLPSVVEPPARRRDAKPMFAWIGTRAA